MALHVNLWFVERRQQSLARIRGATGDDVTVDDLDLVAELPPSSAGPELIADETDRRTPSPRRANPSYPQTAARLMAEYARLHRPTGTARGCRPGQSLHRNPEGAVLSPQSWTSTPCRTARCSRPSM